MTLVTRPARTFALVGAALSMAAMLSACGGGGHKAAASSSAVTSTTASTSSTPSATATPASVNPFTGGAPSSLAVVAVKIDDTENGRPQVNIEKADMVYVEQVEGGLTRLLAIYNTTLPTVEAVRSTRASDPELVEQFGLIDYAASGGAPNPLAVLDASHLRATINDRGGPGFARDPNRGAPYNLTANLTTVANALHGPGAKSIGLLFSADPATYAAAPAATSVNTVVGATAVSFDWNAALQRWVRLIGGVVQHAADGTTISTPNVIVQFCAVTDYPQDVDVMGNISKYTHTVGSGRAVIFRNGHRLEGTWSRSSATAPTVYKSRLGNPVYLAPGGEWILLVATGAPLS
jgi:hypothetical protein